MCERDYKHRFTHTTYSRFGQVFNSHTVMELSDIQKEFSFFFTHSVVKHKPDGTEWK